MPLWGLSDASSNVVKTVASSFNVGSGQTAQAANNTAMYGNTTPGDAAKGSGTYQMAVGTFGVSAAEMANTSGENKKVNHAGWNVRRAFTGPVSAIAIANGGASYTNTDLVKVSGGITNAAGTLTTNSTGGLATVTLTTPGSGFLNVGASTVAITNSTGGTSAGSGGVLTFTLGGRAGRVTYETIVAMGSMSNGTSDDTQLPQ